MKNILFSICLAAAAVFAAAPVQAQIKVEGGFFRVKAGIRVNCVEDVRVQSGGTVNNADTIVCQNLVSLAGGTTRGTGKYFAQENLTLGGAVLDAGIYGVFGDIYTSTISSDGAIVPKLLLAKTGEAQTAYLGSPITVKSNVTFKNNCKLSVNNHDLTLQTAATVTGAGATQYFITDFMGRLVRQGVGAAVKKFDVGTDALTYNPVEMTNTGTVDAIGVRCLPNAYQGGSTGAALTADAVNASWDVTEAVAGGSNLALTVKWRTTDELSGFVRSACSVRRHDGTAWDSHPLSAATGAGTATNPWKQTRAGLTTLGFFAVLDGNLFDGTGDDRAADEPYVFAEAETEPEAAAIHIFPNPARATDRLTLRLTGEFDGEPLRLLDATGRVLREIENVQTDATLSVQDLAPGVYFLMGMSADGQPVAARLVRSAD